MFLIYKILQQRNQFVNFIGLTTNIKLLIEIGYASEDVDKLLVGIFPSRPQMMSEPFRQRQCLRIWFLRDFTLLLHCKPSVVKIFNPDLLNAGADINMANYPPVPLFVVQKNQRISNAFTSLNYRGDTYALPADSGSFTKDVMVLLSQLLTLNKIAGSIPASPSVLVK